jgi:hypothetical protein
MQKQIEVSEPIQVDIFELMDDNLTETELLQYIKERSLGDPGCSEHIEALIYALAEFPEFVPTLIDMHYRNLINVDELKEELQRTETRLISRYDIAKRILRVQ